MGLLDDLANPPQKATGFAGWVIAQEPDVRAALEKAAADPRWSTYALMRLMKSYGASCSTESVAPWRIKHGYVAD